jgi:ATP/maltotriose-dependent transcriptional regulator MalT/DNA-binding SARP family transcriptional activator
MSVQSAGRIARPALERRISEGFEAGSVLLVAGAGYGKTMALEEAIAVGGLPSIWLTCAQSGGVGRLLLETVEGLSRAVPGLTDVVGESLVGRLEPVDAPAVIGTLRTELERLLVEPVVVVFDDAEALHDDPAALAFLREGLLAVSGPLSVAIASRRPLPLKLTKLRAAGRLVEIGPAELSLTAGECEELLRLRHGAPVASEEVAAVVTASEGWPLGVALSAMAGPTVAGAGPVPHEELFAYLAEEVLERLDAEERAQVVESSVVATMTPELVVALGLPPDFLERTERSGLFLRTHPSGERSYHPLFRAFLLERLDGLRGPAERAALHERAAAALAGEGQEAAAIEHWLAACNHERALDHLGGAGANLVRTSPESVTAWLATMPDALRRDPRAQILEGQLCWGAGDHVKAWEELRGAVAGFEAAGDEDRAWLARIYLADTLVFLGRYEEVSEVAAGWEEVSAPIATYAAMAVAWFEVVALSTIGAIDRAEELRARLRRDPAAAAQFSFIDVLSQSGRGLAAGQCEDALALLHAKIAELELDDPLGRLPYALGMVLVILRNLGRREAIPPWLERCETEASRVGLGFALRDFRLQRASWLAQEGSLAAAEAQLAAAGERRGSGWDAVYLAEARAHVASLRGDLADAVAAARTALEIAADAPMPWRALIVCEMSELLAEAGEVEAGEAAIATTLAALDERFPGEPGSLHRAWLLTARACLEYRTGEVRSACCSLARAWEEAAREAGAMVRRWWPGLRPLLWDALATGDLAPDAVVAALREAFAGGEALVEMVDHPQPEVRRAALRTALAADHPAVLQRLSELVEDDDGGVATAALATRRRLGPAPPPLRLELLGGFRLRRAGWELDEASWQRPMAARVVRFLLIQGAAAVPEDALFEAFWPDRDADAARQHLTVAISRARKVLDLPGVEESAIEVRERTYRLALRERDSVDAVEFEAAAAAALADTGPGRLAALRGGVALWTGEPLPEDRYEEWSAAWRARLVGTYADLLGALIEAHFTAAEHDEAIRIGRRLLAVEPLNEAAHRSLMVAYARTGRTSHALRQYLECRRRLVVELGIEPGAETTAVHARILAGERV